MYRRLAVCAAALVTALPGCGGDDEAPRNTDPLAAALAYLPSEALAVGTASTQLQVGEGGTLAQRLARVPATELLIGEATRLAAEAGLTTDGLRAQAGSPVAVALPDLVDLTESGTPLAAWSVRDEGALRQSLDAAVERQSLESAGEYRGAALYRALDGVPAYAYADGVLLLGKDPDTLRLAIDRRAEGRGMTTEQFDERLADIPATTPVRLSVSAPVALAGPRFAELRQIPWVSALERVVIGVRADRDGVAATVLFDTSESDLVDADLPIARGAEAPPVPRFGALRVGMRSPGATAVFAQRVWRAVAPEAYARYEAAQVPLLRARVDPRVDLLGRLSGPALLATDFEDSRLRVGLRDPEGFADALAQSRFLLPPVFAALGLPGLMFTVAPDGATQVSSNAVLRARAGVVNARFVVSTREQDLARVERAPVERVQGAEGAFVARMISDRLRATTARLVGLREAAGYALDGVGDGTLVVRAESEGVRATLRFDIG
jgi:hypothetical protein